MSAKVASSCPRSVVVLGAGIAGLTAAYRLRQAGAMVHVLEANDRCGGPMHSLRLGDHLFELGPTTVPSTAPHLGRLIDDLGLREKVQLSQPQAGRRLIWRRGRLHALPEKPPQLLTCSALGWLSKLRLFAEPLIAPRPDDEPETLADFGRRRLGPGAVAAFLDPFVIGVFAGRIDQLGVDALPRLADWERQHGSLFRAAIAQRRQRASAKDGAEKSGPPPLLSFPEGLETLPKALRESLGDAIRTRCQATAVEDRADGFRVTYRQAEKDHTLEVDAIVVATPADVTARLLSPYLDRPTRSALETIEHPFVATVGLAYPKSQSTHPLDAFGLLVASDSRLPAEADVLGVLFASSIFAGRAPDGEVTLTVMIGGARDPIAASLSDSGLAARAQQAVRQLLGFDSEPTAVQVTRWPRAIPQYAPGHRTDVVELRRRLAERGGLAVAGNYLDGVGVESAIASADAAAEVILDE